MDRQTKALIAVLILLIGAWAAMELVVPGPFTTRQERNALRLKQECRDQSIIQAGLVACHRDPMCNLNDEEVFTMYRAGKRSVIVCERWTKVEEYNLMELELALQEKALEELTTGEPTEPVPEPEQDTEVQPLPDDEWEAHLRNLPALRDKIAL